MKSEHRHELETNWLAHHTAIWLERIQPYNSLIVGALLTILILMFAYSYFGGETSARQSAAWNSYNEAVEGGAPDIDRLRESAEEFPDSPMQQLADITWADGQLFLASRFYFANRAASNDAMSRASGAYLGLLRQSEDERVKSRAHFGLARIYELQNQLDKAKEEYKLVTGGFAAVAENRIKELDKPDTKETYAWLATAEGPRATAPIGPGIPGQQPQFAPGELDLPAAKTPAEEKPISVDDLFEGFGGATTTKEIEGVDRYLEGAPSTELPASETPKSDGAADGAADDAKPKE
jgi:predicted negative regulator of RcsB-dependent stress response